MLNSVPPSSLGIVFAKVRMVHGIGNFNQEVEERIRSQTH